MNITEYAKTNGISRTPVWKLRKSKGWDHKTFEVMDGNRIELTEAGIAFLDEKLKRLKTVKTRVERANTEKNETDQNRFDFLQKQISEKDKQIEKLQTALDQEQKLNLALRIEHKTSEEGTAEAKETPKKGFWARIFK